MADFNNWNVSYSIIKNFENALQGHAQVSVFSRVKDIYFIISRKDGMTLNVVLLDEYCVGLAAVLKVSSDFPEADYIVTGGSWNGYTEEAKEYGKKNSIGIFNIAEFLGALNWTRPKTYYKKDRDGNPVHAYKNS